MPLATLHSNDDGTSSFYEEQKSPRSIKSPTIDQSVTEKTTSIVRSHLRGAGDTHLHRVVVSLNYDRPDHIDKKTWAVTELPKINTVEADAIDRLSSFSTDVDKRILSKQSALATFIADLRADEIIFLTGLDSVRLVSTLKAMEPLNNEIYTYPFWTLIGAYEQRETDNTGSSAVIALIDTGYEITRHIESNVIEKYRADETGLSEGTSRYVAGSDCTQTQFIRHGTDMAHIAVGAYGVSELSPVWLYAAGKCKSFETVSDTIWAVSFSSEGILNSLDDIALCHLNGESNCPDIVNMSFGGTYSIETCSAATGSPRHEAHRLLHQLGVSQFSGTGNDGFLQSILYPACLDVVTSVGASISFNMGDSPYTSEPHPVFTDSFRLPNACEGINVTNGNYPTELFDPDEEGPEFPRYQCVGTRDTHMWTDSNYAFGFVDLAAPSYYAVLPYQAYSFKPTYSCHWEPYSDADGDQCYSYAGGTSGATAITSGVAALVLSKARELGKDTLLTPEGSPAKLGMHLKNSSAAAGKFAREMKLLDLRCHIQNAAPECDASHIEPTPVANATIALESLEGGEDTAPWLYE